RRNQVSAVSETLLPLHPTRRRRKSYDAYARHDRSPSFSKIPNIPRVEYTISCLPKRDEQSRACACIDGSDQGCVLRRRIAGRQPYVVVASGIMDMFGFWKT